MALEELLESENVHIRQLDSLVREFIAEERTLSSRLAELEKDENISIGQRVADKVAEFGGSWTFIISFFFFMTIWIITNAVWLADKPLDPYPFILLNLMLSCLAALQAPVIMMSQNRQEDKDRRRARSDFLVNLKAELEVRSLHGKIDLLIAEEMKTLFKVQQTQLEILLDIKNAINALQSR
jgi:uncharacterized membrane protein